MTTIVKYGSALALVTMLATPLSALAFYPYTYFTGPSSFTTGGGFYAQQPNYYGSSNCNDIYGCGTIGYDAMTGQWSNGGLMGGYTQAGMPTGGCNPYVGCYSGGYGGYNNQAGGCYSCGVSQYSNSYMQYVPASARQYMGGYGGGYGGYGTNGYIY
ncbi:MAG TPA: hypothetical protein VIY48_02315 [Candidatus Paceibacterota bacterium]